MKLKQRVLSMLLVVIFFFHCLSSAHAAGDNISMSNDKENEDSSVQTLLEVESIKVEKVDEESKLNFLPFGVFGNGDVSVTVEAVGTDIEEDTTIYLGTEDIYNSKEATPELGEDGRYHYTADFTYDSSMFRKDDSEESKSITLNAYAVNSSGESKKFTTLSGISDVDNSDKVIDSQPFLLEEKNPSVDIGELDSNSSGIKCDIKVSDSDSGIAKIEYGWDLEETYCDDKKNQQTGHYCGFEQNKYTNDYVDYNFDNSNIVYDLEFSLELAYEDSVWVESDKHTIYIRVTDNAGNVTYSELQDSVGSDMLPPNITGVKIRKAEENKVDSVLNFLNFGIFSNDSVEIVILADDNEGIANTYASGICEVTVNDRVMRKNDKGEYVLTVFSDDMINEMSVTAKDNAGWSTTKVITDIPDKTGSINSNILMVENDEPTISWDFSFAGYTDNTGKVWYGEGENSETFNIVLKDDKGNVKSGLHSIKITDNDETIFEEKEFSSIESEYTQTYTIKDFKEGAHTIVVTVEDNAGNIAEDAKTFYIDRTLPENGIISIISPECIEIDGKQWFEKEEVITFRVDSSDVDSGLKSISLKVNEQSFQFADNQILSDENGNYVLIDTKNINPDTEHKYIVSGVATDVANNSLKLETCTVYKDCENPCIEKFVVEKKSEALDKVLNVLKFGVYANDTLIFKAYVSDAEFDSGVDYVTVFYDGLAAPEKMINEGNGVFSIEIPKNENVFESDIIVTAYDKYGKSSITCPNIENAKNGDVSGNKWVMIETIKPVMTLSLPASDSVTEVNEQRWYKYNKSIELKVQDENSGIRNINFSVNGVDITSDKNGSILFKTDVTEIADEKNTEEHKYVFDTDYITEKVGEPADGKYVINTEIIDNAGNIRQCEAVYYIDKIAPKIDKIEFTPLTADDVKETTEFMEELDYGFYFKTDFVVTVYISDKLSSSGLNQVNYRLVPYENGVNQEEITGVQKISDGKVILTVPKGFKGQILVEAFDNVANSSGEKTTKAYVVDGEAPEINIIKNVSTSYHDAEGNNLYVEDNNITVEITDMVSGIKEIAYSQRAEKESYDRRIVIPNDTRYNVGDILEEGWTVAGVDENLVTKVTKTFNFSSDDNDVVLTFHATDNAMNKKENVESERFTVDKKSPVINISFRDDEDGDVYYNQNRIADIMVIDRNFDEELIKVDIQNTFGTVPSFSFEEKSKTEHVAVVEFDEGDYTFDVTGTDLGNHAAIVNFSGGNEKLFFVDKTKPEIEENFATFSDTSTENSFNTDKIVDIKVTEHNFDPALVNLSIYRKDAGAEHDGNELVDVTPEVLGAASWNSSGDVHTLSFTVSNEAVYQVEVTPSDLAGNTAEHRNTVEFEIDKTAPVVKAKNGIPVSSNDTEYVDIYSYSRKDEPAPNVEFDDLNIDHINYTLTVYIPDYTSEESEIVIKPVRVYLEEDENKTGTIMGNKFVLPDFVEDGVYALELTAVDVAGNESLLNVNTYARMVEQDVLAYIMESNLEQKTGLYSFQYENGDAISKRPDDFSDIKIAVLAKNDKDVDIVLRDCNGNEFNTDTQVTTDSSTYGMSLYDFTLEADYFKENFQSDTDNELYLTVKNGENRIDLGKMHIDNIAPTCDIPEKFRSWKWYCGEEERTITISNISELIDEEQCKVYDNGKEMEFQYSSKDGTIEFTLGRGWHNVGIILDDMAGNTYNIQERSNIYIGFFWLWLIGGALVVLVGTVGGVIIHSKRKKYADDL